MDRGSDTHGPMQDDYLKKELHGLEQADHPTRAEEWRDPEPPADDDPLLDDPRGAGESGLTTVADLMTPEVISVSPAASAAEAAAVMRENDVGSVFVVDGDRAVGVVTDRDLAVRVLGAGRTPETTSVMDVCTAALVTVLDESDAQMANDVMREHAVRRVLVVGTDDRPRGVISLGDLTVAQGPWSVLSDIVLASPPSNAEED